MTETTDVRVAPFAEVDLAFARDEGDGFESVADWRAAHVRLWESEPTRAELGRTGFRVRGDTPVGVERFRLVDR